MDKVNLESWLNRRVVVKGEITQKCAKLIQMVLGLEGKNHPKQGERLPPLWHWYAFPSFAIANFSSEDTELDQADFMPPVQSLSRFWVGGNVEFIAPILVGDKLWRRTQIARINEVEDETGERIDVGLDHEIHSATGLCVLERQNVCYVKRESKLYLASQTPLPVATDIAEPIAFKTPLLQRYAARAQKFRPLHLDLSCTEGANVSSEVLRQGPLQANRLMNLATEHSGNHPNLFSYSVTHPPFSSDELMGNAIKHDDCNWSLFGTKYDGTQTMQANAIWTDY